MDNHVPEQSMEDILASIKRVISADVDAARRLPAARPAPVPAEDDILELGEPPVGQNDFLVSGAAAEASKAALAGLSTIGIDPKADATTLDGLVREMLRPMLKSWLDARLPDIVERVVAAEVARVLAR
jgi:cell pole-organizing protein PopZ